MPARLYVPHPLTPGPLDLPEGPARHVQVLRLQPGMPLTLFDGRGGEWQATVEQMGRQAVRVSVGEHEAVERELPLRVTLALGMPANDRMDDLVEKATELGVTAIQPLITQRSVLRLAGERAQRRREHWQAIAVAACEQSGRTRVPEIAPVAELAAWLAQPAAGAARWLLSPGAAQPLAARRAGLAREVVVLSGPEGGLAPDEEDAARARGFEALALGPRILRADTAPLAVLAALSLAD